MGFEPAVRRGARIAIALGAVTCVASLVGTRPVAAQSPAPGTALATGCTPAVAPLIDATGQVLRATLTTGCRAPTSSGAAASQLPPPPCQVVPAYTARCPAWISAPYAGPTGAGAFAGDGSSQTRIEGISPDGDTAFVAGEVDVSASSSTTTWDCVVLAYDMATGATRWTAQYAATPAGSDCHFLSLAVSPDGSAVYATGYTTNTTINEFDAITVAYDAATGSQRWVTLVPNAAAYAVKAAPDGSRVYVSLSGAGAAAYDPASGAQLWRLSYSETGQSYASGTAAFTSAYGIDVSPDGTMLFVNAYDIGSDGYCNAWVPLAVDAATGALRWHARWAAPGNPPAGIAAARDGSRVFITGTNGKSPGGFSYETLAFDAASGSQLWSQSYAGSFAGSFNTPWYYDPIAVSPHGHSVFVTGYGNYIEAATNTTVTTNYGIATIAYDTGSGAQQWLTRFDSDIDGQGALGLQGQFFPALTVDPHGSRVYMASSDFFVSTSTYIYSVYDVATGAQTEVSRYADGDSIHAGIAVSPDGSTVVIPGDIAGEPPGNAQVMTIAYATNGAPATIVPEAPTASLLITIAPTMTAALWWRHSRRRRSGRRSLAALLEK